MFVLLGSLLLGAIPSVSSWGTVYASSDSNVLTTASQVQSKLTSAMKSRLSHLSFTYKGETSSLKSLLNKAVTGALDADVYTKYVVDSYSFSWRGTGTSATVTVRFVFRETAEQTTYVNNRVKQVVKDIITPGMNDHGKIKAIHDWIVLHLKYDTKLRKYTAYDGIKTGEAVCQGYALLAYKLLQQAGIHNLIVEGTAGDQLHAWNLVKLQGNWYHMDTTWDDPTPDQSGRVHYNYYLRTDKQMRKDHTWTRKYPPAAVSYRDTLQTLADKSTGAAKVGYETLREDLGYTLYTDNIAVHSASGLKDKVMEAIRQDQRTATIRYSGSLDQLTDDLSRLYDLNISQITYYNEPLEDTPDWKVRVDWEN